MMIESKNWIQDGETGHSYMRESIDDISSSHRHNMDLEQLVTTGPKSVTVTKSDFPVSA